MAAQFAFFLVWLLGMFGIVGIVVGSVARFVKYDTQSYDEQFVWGKKLESLLDKRK